MTRLGLLVVLIAATGLPLAAQQQAAAFEVASVKRNNDGGGTTTMGIAPSGRFVARNVPLRDLIGYSYGNSDPFIPLSNNRIIGGPDWVDRERFDIEAVPDAGGTRPGAQQVMQMLRSLLTERFRLVAHKQQQELPVFVLTVARSDGTLGPKLLRSTGGCSVPVEKRSGPSSCGMQRRRGYIEAHGMTVDEIVLHGLHPNLDRVVINKTGLKGDFDWTLQWVADPNPPSDDPGRPLTDALGPSISTAMLEQLGLKLEPSRGPVEVLVIDSVERPTPD
jgi:uncharacterized protein (TIGR03435 family)